MTRKSKAICANYSDSVSPGVEGSEILQRSSRDPSNSTSLTRYPNLDAGVALGQGLHSWSRQREDICRLRHGATPKINTHLVSQHRM